MSHEKTVRIEGDRLDRILRACSRRLEEMAEATKHPEARIDHEYRARLLLLAVGARGRGRIVLHRDSDASHQQALDLSAALFSVLSRRADSALRRDAHALARWGTGRNFHIPEESR